MVKHFPGKTTGVCKSEHFSRLPCEDLEVHELDILQRELNQSLMIYDPNPQKALRENVTCQNIKAHRKAIEDKKKEIAELQSNLSDLEDELRHAGGDPGWSRE